MGEKRAEEESRRKHQAQLSGRAKDTVTRRTVMILVSDHTYTHPPPPPPTEILSAFSLLCQPPPPAPCIISSSMSISSEQPRHGSPRTWPASVHRTGPHKVFQESATAGQQLLETLQALVRALLQVFQSL